MIKVSVMYPTSPDARFDHAYYATQHMPMVQDLLREYCTHYTVDKGVAGGAPGTPAPYIAMCHLFFDSVDAFQTGFAAHGNAIMADIPNYTNLSPVVQISEVIVG